MMIFVKVERFQRQAAIEKENREHRDSVLGDFLYGNETVKKNLLSLYHALHDMDMHVG